MRKSRSLSKIHDLKRKNHQAEHEAQGLSILSQAEPSQAEPSQAKLSRAQAKSSQAKPSQDKLSRSDPI